MALGLVRRYGWIVSWLDDLIPASLNGVPFSVRSASKRGGRRSRVHEFADVDGGWVEDSGAVPHRHQIDAFIVGENYHVTLQDLEEVLDAGGALEFDHPRRGPIGNLYIEGEYDTEESSDKGGYARVSFILVLGGPDAPLIFESTPAKVKVYAQRVRAAADANFKKKYSGRNMFGSALRFLRRLSGALRRLYGKSMAAFGPIADLRNAVDALDAAIDQIVNLPGDIANLFKALAESFTKLFAKKAKDLGRPDGAPQALADATKESIDSNKTPDAQSDYESVVGSEEYPTGTALIAKSDLDALNVCWSASMISWFCEVLVDLPLPNADAADTMQAFIAEVLDELLAAEVGDGPIDSDLYDELITLKVTVAELLTEVGGQLPPVTIYTPPTTVPLVIAAYHQAGQTGKGLSDLVRSMLELNTIEDPLVVPDGTPLKVVLT